MHGSEESWSKQRGWEEAAKGHQEGAKSNRASKWRKTLKKNYFRQKEGWVETSGDRYCHCPLLCALIIPVFSNRSDQKASILFSG